MNWSQIRGHSLVTEYFRRCWANGRLANTFLFIGPSGIGKRTFALQLAKALLCQASPDKLESCDLCPSCQQVAAGTHPDVIRIAKPAEKTTIPLELFIGDRDHRMQEGLCHEIGLKPFHGGRKVAIIDDADWLNQEGANCLLKTLEEPPLDSILILIGTSEQRQLPTIRSRCQIVRFRPLDEPDVARLLVEKSLVADPAQAGQLATLSQGSLERAVEFSDEIVAEFRKVLLDSISSPPWQPGELVPAISSFVDAAGKEGAPRRARLRQSMEMVGDLYRQTLRAVVGQAPQADVTLDAAAAKLKTRWQWGTEGLANCLDTCLECRQFVDAMVSQATVIEYWLDELASITRSGHGTAKAHRPFSSN